MTGKASISLAASLMLGQVFAEHKKQQQEPQQDLFLEEAKRRYEQKMAELEQAAAQRQEQERAERRQEFEGGQYGRWPSKFPPGVRVITPEDLRRIERAQEKRKRRAQRKMA